jgi:hypothetical protein
MRTNLMTLGSRRLKATSEACYKYVAERSDAANEEDGVRK